MPGTEAKPLSKALMSLYVFVGAYPISMIINTMLQRFFAPLPLALHVFIVTVTMVICIVYGVIPAIHKLRARHS